MCVEKTAIMSTKASQFTRSGLTTQSRRIGEDKLSAVNSNTHVIVGRNGTHKNKIIHVVGLRRRLFATSKATTSNRDAAMPKRATTNVSRSFLINWPLNSK
ncbi:uncharacterized protein LOC105205730 [Solenopsis invicta]|uniref:uncharacterized protein LOC105205730 n=1 Tax=Solenopsis invicta TaxID=13686 RepID=UPI0005959BDC|nr:uncharacterized protein LOC105205730 [Solenopsis invicta]